MGLFDTLTDAFTGQPTKDAAAQQRNYYDSQGRLVTSQNQTAQQQGLAALQSGQTAGVDAVRAGTATGRSDVTGAGTSAVNYLNDYTNRGAGALQSGQTSGISALQGGEQRASDAYNGLDAAAGRYGSRATGASDLYASALGIGGADPTLAQNSFKAGPGYKFALEQGLEGITRGANSSGMAAGGNQLRAAGEYATGAANQEYQKYLDNVFKQEQLNSPLEANALNQAAGGRASAATSTAANEANLYAGTGSRLADLYSSTGKTGAGIMSDTGKSLADLASRGGTNEANIFSQGGQSSANLISNLSGQMTDYQKATQGLYGNTYGAAGAAAQGGSANLWNLIGGGVTAAAKYYGDQKKTA